MLPGRDLTKLSLLGFAFSFIPGKPSWLTKPRSRGGAFSVAGLCKDAAGLSVPLGDGWSAPRFWGLLTGKPTPPPLRRMPRQTQKEGPRSFILRAVWVRRAAKADKGRELSET